MSVSATSFCDPTRGVAAGLSGSPARSVAGGVATHIVVAGELDIAQSFASDAS